MSKLTEKEKLEQGIQTYFNAWFEQLPKKERTDANLKAIEFSYRCRRFMKAKRKMIKSCKLKAEQEYNETLMRAL